MAETKVESATEEIVAQEGSINAELNKEARKEPETVPVGVVVGLKDDIKQLKKELKEAKASTKPEVTDKAIKSLTEKYPDVSSEFIEDILASATEKVDAKYKPILEPIQAERKQADFDKAFDNIFNKVISENPDLPKDIDRELVKELALTPKYNNIPVSELVKKLYPQTEEMGRATAENDMRPATDIVSDVVDIEKITPEQRTRIIADPKARKAYYDKLDALGR